MATGRAKASLLAKVWLLLVLFLQVFVTPFVAFCLTYLLEFTSTDSSASVQFRFDMMPWILAASVSYGLLAFTTAAVLGGWRPLRVVERGGWAATLGFARAPRQTNLIRNARHEYARSPHGRLALLAHDRMLDDHPITVTHGGLILLAVPFQTVLVILPIALMVAIPDGLVVEGRHLAMTFILYLIALMGVFHIYTIVASRLVGVAASMRRFLKTMTRLSNFAPIFVLWLLGRLASVIVLTWFEGEIDLTLHLERDIFRSLIGETAAPDGSFLDLMTALAVIPLSVHATLACLEGGGLDPPRWLRPRDEDSERGYDLEAQRRADHFQAVRASIMASSVEGRLASFDDLQPSTAPEGGEEGEGNEAHAVRGLG
jgi:hypothetical protein